MKKKHYVVAFVVTLVSLVLTIVYMSINTSKNVVIKIRDKADFSYTESENTGEVSVLCADSMWNHVMIVAENEDVYEWTSESGKKPQKVDELENIKEVVMGGGSTYALNKDGVVYKRYTEADTNIISSNFREIYCDENIKKIAVMPDGCLVLITDKELMFMQSNPLDYIPSHGEYSLATSVSINGVRDLCGVGRMRFVLDEKNFLWSIVQDKEKIKIADDISKIFTEGNHLIAIDTGGHIHDWFLDKTGNLQGGEEEEDGYESVVAIDEDNLITSDGCLYCSKWMWAQGAAPSYSDQRIIYYNHQVFITEAGDVFFIDKEKEYSDYFVYVMNIFFPPEEENEDENTEELIYPGQEMRGLFANTKSYILFLDENHILYEWSLKKLKKRTEINNIHSVYLSCNGNYILDNDGNVYFERRTNDITYGFERLNVKDVQAIYTSSYHSTVAFSDGRRIFIMNESDNKKIECDIPACDVINIQIMREYLLILKTDFTLWVVNIYPEMEQTLLESKQIASNIRWIESNDNYTIAVDFDNVGYFWYPPDFEDYRKSEGFEDIKITSGNFGIDSEGYLYDIYRGYTRIYEEEKVIYLWDNLFMTLKGDVFSIKQEEDSELMEKEYLFNMYDLKDVPEKIRGIDTYDLNNKVPLDRKYEFDVQKLQTIEGYKEYKVFSEGAIAAARLLPEGLKWGFIDMYGNEIVPCIYDEVENFCNGLAKVTLNYESILINKEGDEEKKCAIDSYINGMLADNLSEGLVSFESGGKIGFADKEGNTVIEPQYEPDTFHYLNYKFSKGMCKVKLDGLIGCIDKTGKMVIPNCYDWIGDFNDGIALYSMKNKRGYMNEEGEHLFEPIFDVAFPFIHGVAFINHTDAFYDYEGTYNEWYIMDEKGTFADKVITEIRYMEFLQDGVFAFISDRGEAGLMNMYGDILVKGIMTSFDNFAFVCDEKTYGLKINDNLEIYKIEVKQI